MQNQEQLHRNRHHAIPDQGAQLRQVVQGYFAYHAVPTNARRMSSFRHHVVRAWLWALRRGSQKDSFSWDRIILSCVQRYRSYPTETGHRSGSLVI